MAFQTQETGERGWGGVVTQKPTSMGAPNPDRIYECRNAHTVITTLEVKIHLCTHC